MVNVYQKLINKYKNISLIILLIVFIIFIFSAKQFQLDASSDTLILEQDKDLIKYREIIKNYGSSDFLIVTFTDKNRILKTDNLELIKLFINKIKTLEWVENVQSVFDVPLLDVNEQTLSDLANEVLTIESSGISLIEAEREMIQSPIFKNLIISEDGTSTGLIIYFKDDAEHQFLIDERDRLKEIKKPNEQEINYYKKIIKDYDLSKREFDLSRHININEIRGIIKQFSNQNLKINLGGVSMIADDTITFVKNDIIIFGIGAIFFILIVLYVVFRNFLWMFICISNCFASLIVMIGTVSLLGWKVTVISSNFIMLMLILSLSMTVHIVVRYRQFLLNNSEISIGENVNFTIQKMYKPCLFAALTSIFAFATLYTSGIKPVMDFGLMMCAGISITYLTSFLFLPTLINFLKLNLIDIPKVKNRVSLLSNISQRYPNLILFFFTLIFFIGLYGSSRLTVENSFVDYFKKETEIYKGMKLIDDKLGGTTPLDIVIDFNQDEENDFIIGDDNDDYLDFGIEYDPLDYWFTKEKIDTIKKIHDHLESYPFAGKVLSLASVIRTAERLNSNNEFDTLELSVLYKKLPDDLKVQIIDPYILIDKNQARISMRIIDTHPDLRRTDFIENLNNYIKDNFSSGSSKVSVAGILVLYNNMLSSLFDSQIKSLSIVLLGIFFMLLILFRSFKIALAAIIPNLIACFAILGTMGMLSIPLDLMTITIAAITIGIAVDNNIHYVYRYQEFLKTNDHDKTISYCDKTVGVAIRNTSYTIIAGFSILIFSNFYPTIYFGIFTALAMLIALVGSLTLLPVLLKKFQIN